MERQIVFLAVVCLLTGVLAHAQIEQKEYILTKLGRDTIAVEEFTADAIGLRGTSVARSNRTTLREYSARFNAAGNLENFHVTYTRGGATVSEREYLYSNDSVNVTIKQDTSTTRYAVAAQDRPFPFFIDIFGAWQASLQRAMAAGKKEFGVIAAKRILRYSIEELSPGKLKLVNREHDFGPLAAELGKENQLEKFDMTATTDKFIAERISPVDVSTMAKEYAEREKAGKALGVLSPRDTVQAEINGAHILIDYGRPAVRGRKIFGGVVAWDSVWRTGANAATQLTMDKEIRFGSIVVPPGTYTLFSVPATGRLLLIINRQHGQWGTEYDQTKDLARLPMETRLLDELVERFTFELSGQGTEGLLRFKWEHTEASIPFTVP